MAEDLWKLREQRGLTQQQLANKAGVPLLSLQEYEQGHPIRAADLSRLAKAMFIDELDIKVRSEPRPRPQKTPPSKKAAPPPEKPVPEQIPEQKKGPSPQPARPTQITHLLEMGQVLGLSEEEIVAEAGKPLAELTLQEARALLYEYQTQRKAQIEQAEAERPPGTRRKRAHLPEGVDEFELEYLQACQEAADTLTFVLLNGETFSGSVIGFSPYNITIRRVDGTEMVIQKLALAYYYREGDT